MNRQTSRNVVRTCLIAASTGALGFAVATSRAADDAKPHAHAAAMSSTCR